ncbi:MAG: GNAT family N-acetyltransferase [Chloroflexota bacterium]
MIYTDSLENITAENLKGGFFVGWLNPPSAETHYKLLDGSYRIWLALDDKQVIGFIHAISDGVLTSFIPLLEVLPDYQGRGIGQELVKRMLASLDHLYSVDLMCDNDLIPYYEKFGLHRATGMLQRNYDRQSGAL